MTERPTTATIIMEIEKTQKQLDVLIKYYKYLEKLLKGPARKSARNVKSQIEKLRYDYMEDLMKHMKKLREEAKKAEKKRLEEERKRMGEARKLKEQARRYREEAMKLRRI